MYRPSASIAVRRLTFDLASGTLVPAPEKALFLRGPIPMPWLQRAAGLPGKTLHVAVALWWRYGMAQGKPFTLTRLAMKLVCIERDAASAALSRLEQAGLIHVHRKPGRRPVISIIQPTPTS